MNTIGMVISAGLPDLRDLHAGAVGLPQGHGGAEQLRPRSAAGLIPGRDMATSPPAADPVTLLADLIRCASVTPTEAGVLDVLERALTPLGFTVTRLRFEGDGGTYPVDNLFATRGTSGSAPAVQRPHRCRAARRPRAVDARSVRRRDRRRRDVWPRGGRHEVGRRRLHRGAARRRRPAASPSPSPMTRSTRASTARPS